MPQRAPAYRPRGRPVKGVRATARAALRLARSLAREVEPKFLNGTVGNTDWYPAGNPTIQLVGIAQGDAINQRAGNRVNLKRIDVSVRLAGLVQSINNFRVLVVQDLQTAATTPFALTDVLQTATTSSVYQPLKTSRFKILYDQKRTLNSAFLNGDVGVDLTFSIKSFANAGLVEYLGAAGGDYSKNNVQLFLIGDSSSAGFSAAAFGANDAQYYVNYIVYFTDQ